jgi:hypothetical protein
VHPSVRYWSRSLLGMAICFVCVLGMTWALYHLVRTGTCASGGPYVSARPCPEGTGTKILALMGCIFGGLIGLGVYATRGGRGEGTLGLGIVMWALLFVSLAVATIVAAYGPANNDDPGARTAAIVLGIVFIPMGLIPLLGAVGLREGRRRRRGGRTEDGVPTARSTIISPPRAASAPPRPAPAPTAGQATGDALERLKKLGELRAAGVITDAEFEAKKAEILKGI